LRHTGRGDLFYGDFDYAQSPEQPIASRRDKLTERSRSEPKDYEYNALQHNNHFSPFKRRFVMSRNKMSGFTLIELMVVIVIIGVLASLAIPRFSEASDKAKVAEAPRILASFESAYLAGAAEVGDSVTMDAVIFDTASLSSRWFKYKTIAGTKGGTVKGLSSVAESKIGKINKSDEICTMDTASGSGKFIHSYKTMTYATGKKYVPNFLTKDETTKCP
jgi:prepilin-type N-terminal cleavage/methylation domain-containing protein